LASAREIFFSPLLSLEAAVVVDVAGAVCAWAAVPAQISAAAALSASAYLFIAM
jgi:hypothetical protein